MKPADFNLDTLIEYLKGTCKSMQEGVNSLYEGMDEDDLAMSDIEAIEEEIGNCSRCGWWVEVNEINEVDSEQVCDGCLEDGEGDED